MGLKRDLGGSGTSGSMALGAEQALAQEGTQVNTLFGKASLSILFLYSN